MAPPLLPLSPAAGEAGRKFSMKQRRHAARWLTSGAQGHWCWLEKANTIFYWSNCFRSKFGQVRLPIRSKYNPMIPINGVVSILVRIVWTKPVKNGCFCWIYLCRLSEYMYTCYGETYAKREVTWQFNAISMAFSPFLFLFFERWCGGTQFPLDWNSLAYCFNPSLCLDSVLTRIKDSYRKHVWLIGRVLW